MGFTVRKRVRLGRHLSLNLSRRGVSASVRAGRVTVNSRGSLSVRILSWLGFWTKLWAT